MRLLELRLNNLNSLKGHWQINFADDAFLNEGIFAITGPTGAGKTTILDAICLALYGRTPRLKDINGSTNDIMTRGTGECSAEVVIDIDGKQYCCSWYQHRAYKRADGKLAAIKHEITDVKAQKVLEDAKSKTGAFIQNLIGMDFDQFTRSIMLAQGSFAAFLNSNIADRAAILEKITGTAIYAKISAQVFDKCRSEKQALTILESKIGQLRVLSLDDEQKLQSTLKELTERHHNAKQNLAAITEKINWLDELDRLEIKLNDYQTELDAAKRQKQAFYPDSLRLDAANRALEIDSHYRELLQSREQLLGLQQNFHDISAQLPVLNAKLESAIQDTNNAQEVEQAFSHQLNQLRSVIANVRQLDQKIRHLSAVIRDDEARRQALHLRAEQLQSETYHQQHNENNARQQLTALMADMKNACPEAEIHSDRIRVGDQSAQLAELSQDYLAKLQDRANLQAGMERLTQQLNTIAFNKSEIAQAAGKKQQRLLDLNAKLAKFTNDQSLDALQQEQQDIDQVLIQCGLIDDKWQQLCEQNAQLNRVFEQMDKLNYDAQSISGDIQDIEAAVQAKTLQKKDKQAQLYLHQKIAKLEDYISELEDGHPCPLCGATEHPYVSQKDGHPLLNTSDTPPKHQNLDSEIAQIEQQLENSQAQLSQLTISKAAMLARLDEQQQQVPLCHQKMMRLSVDVQDLVKAINTSPFANLAGKPISTLQNTCDQCHDNFQNVFQNGQAKAIDNAILDEVFALTQNLRSKLDQQKSDAITAKNAIIDLTSAIDTANQDLSHDTAQLERLNHDEQGLVNACNLQQQAFDSSNQQARSVLQKLFKQSQSLSKTAEKYDAHDVAKALQVFTAADKLTQHEIERALLASHHLQQQLTDLQASASANSDREQQLKQSLASLQVSIAAKHDQLNEEKEKLAQLTKSMAASQDSLAKLSHQREQIFGNNDPDLELESLQVALDDAKFNLNQSQSFRDRLGQQISAQTEQQTVMTRNINLAKSTLSQLDSSFKNALIEAKFADEAAFLAAMLPRSDRQQLHEQKLATEQRYQTAASLLSSTQALFQSTKAQQLTMASRPDLVHQAQDIQNNIDAWLHDMGAIKQQLVNNDQQKAAQAENLQQIQAQKNALQVWQQLNDLIGSADGKKYRTFAQSLTFEVMINHANQQLQKMSDRYLLVHNADEPLELNVIDNYQGGEIRSTKNLSGGEGFIISLALALGLSQMASQNIRVDSLFLDEGFGTLDEASLDVALDTLTGLQQEGKLIGIISHIPALKARIMTQIKIQKRSGGTSELSGHGCQKLAS